VDIGAGIEQDAHFFRELAPLDGRQALSSSDIRVSAVRQEKTDRVSYIRPVNSISKQQAMQETAFDRFFVLSILIFCPISPITEFKEGICVSVSSREPVSQRGKAPAFYSSHDYFFGRRAHHRVSGLVAQA
jgi:hypothetical protein